MGESSCEWFHWIGQPFWSCDACGRPAWEHKGDHRLKKDARIFPSSDDDWVGVPWKPGQAGLIRQKWEPDMLARRPFARSSLDIAPPWAAWVGVEILWAEE
jgi:hypothetical protein